MLHPGGFPAHKEIRQNSRDSLRIAIPFPFERGACRRASHACPNISVRVENLDELRKSLHIKRISQNKPVKAVVKVISYAREDGSNYRQATRHGFRHGKPERILSARADINVYRSVRIKYFRTRKLPPAAVLQSELCGARTEGLSVVVADHQQFDWHGGKSRHGFQNGYQTLVLPIISYQKQNEILVAKTPPSAGFPTLREPSRHREFLRVHTVRNYVDIFAVKVPLQESGCAL